MSITWILFISVFGLMVWGIGHKPAEKDCGCGWPARKHPGGKCPLDAPYDWEKEI